MKIRWTGETSVNRDLGAAAGNGGVIEHGSTHEAPAELAERLLASSTSWKRVTVNRRTGGKA